MKYFQGFSEAIIGGNFQYHSPHPKITKSLLVRTNKEQSKVEWSTEIVPKDFNEEYISFIWYYGMSHQATDELFDLYINDNFLLSISNPLGAKVGEYKLDGKDNSELSVKATIIDKYNDPMGIAILKVPSILLNKGKSQILRIVGKDKQKPTWYMTFQGKVNSETVINKTDLIIKKDSKQFQIYSLDVVHLDQPKDISVYINDNLSLENKVQTGYNSFDLLIPRSEAGKKAAVKILIDKTELIKDITLEPVREWNINLVMHSHTDIGYTRPQTEIMPEHLRYIDYALDFCDLTDDYPEDAKFRWTCESTWPVKEYLKSRPKSQIDRLRKRVEEGRIELTGMLFNISEMADESLLAGMMQPINEIKDAGFKVESAMQNDINGIGWCFVDYFNASGIKYLIMGEHNHRALIPFDYPTPFWWESPAGNRVLAYRAEHYMTGNMLGLHNANLDQVKKNLIQYLSDISETEYPYYDLHIQMSGYFTDNSPPSYKPCELVKEWNEVFEWPKLKIATATEFLKKIENEHSEELPTYKAAWPDWWADGFGSAARETAESRLAQADLITNNGLLFLAKSLGADLPANILDDINEIEELLLFYAEHTFGYSESVREPMAEQTHVQWLEKASTIWEAVKKTRMLKEKGMGFIQQYLPQYNTPSIAVFNTLNWVRSAQTTIYIDHDLINPENKFKIVDENNNQVFAQKLSSRNDGTYWSLFAEDIPPMGYKVYKIIVEDELDKSSYTSLKSELLENQFYKIEFNKTNGTVSSILDKNLGIELIDQNSDWGFGQFIYEQLSNRAQLERYNLEETPIRTTLDDIKISEVKNGPVWSSIFINGKIEKCADDSGVNLEIRLNHKTKKIDFIYNMKKLPVIDPEAIYVAFPFFNDNSKIIFEAQGGLVRPGVDQLPGTSSDWNVIQNYASIENEKHQITFVSNEIPLAHLGGLNIGRFDYDGKPDNPHIFSWVMNNYWVTNFRASQEGEFTWTYSITSNSKSKNSDQYKFGYGERIPLATRVLPERKNEIANSSSSFINIEKENIVLISAKPVDNMDTFIIQLKEVNGEKTELELDKLFKNDKIELVESNVLGDDLKVTNKIKIKPLETKFVKVKF